MVCGIQGQQMPRVQMVEAVVKSIFFCVRSIFWKIYHNKHLGN